MRNRALIFDKKRAAQKNELQEDYVEMIAQLIANNGEARAADLAREFGVSTARVTAAIRTLKKNGLVSSEPYRSVFLTDEGKVLAEKCKRRHNLIKEFLLCIGVSREQAEQDSEGIEHYLSDESLHCLEEFLQKHKKV